MSFLRKLMGMFTDSMMGKRSTTYRGREVKPASEDPYGDPADQMGPSRMSMGGGGFGSVKPASQDPYGDPADQMPRSRRSMGSNVDPAGDECSEALRAAADLRHGDVLPGQADLFEHDAGRDIGLGAEG